jgi:hypothetical protein
MVGILAALVVSYCEHGWHMAAQLEECVCVFYVCVCVCMCVAVFVAVYETLSC